VILAIFIVILSSACWGEGAGYYYEDKKGSAAEGGPSVQKFHNGKLTIIRWLRGAVAVRHARPEISPK